MRRRSNVLTLGALAVGLFAAGIYVAGGGASPAAAAPTKITVTASEFKFALSQNERPPGTTVVFTVVNKGKIPARLQDRSARKRRHSRPDRKRVRSQVTFPKKRRHIPFLARSPVTPREGMKGTFAGRTATDKDQRHRFRIQVRALEEDGSRRDDLLSLHGRQQGKDPRTTSRSPVERRRR